MLRNTLVSGLKNLSTKLGMTLTRTSQYEELLRQRQALLAQVCEQNARGGNGVEGVVFSKDRPMQLHALLVSYFDKVKNPAPLHVLYNAESDRIQLAYEKVADDFVGKPVTFMRENRFRSDLIALLESLKAPKVFFLVDDILFIDALDMDEFSAFDPTECVPTLRLAPHLRRCYTTNMTQLPPKTLAPYQGRQHILSWNWGDAGNEWNYPMSVDGNLFSTAEITAITKAATFKAPNSYEGALMQFADVYAERPGLCYTRSKIFNIPANKVQTENANLAGDVSAEHLLEQWEKGMVIDPRPLYGFMNESPHQEVPFTFARREDLRRAA